MNSLLESSGDLKRERYVERQETIKQVFQVVRTRGRRESTQSCVFQKRNVDPSGMVTVLNLRESSVIYLFSISNKIKNTQGIPSNRNDGLQITELLSIKYINGTENNKVRPLIYTRKIRQKYSSIFKEKFTSFIIRKFLRM